MTGPVCRPGSSPSSRRSSTTGPSSSGNRLFVTFSSRPCSSCLSRHRQHQDGIEVYSRSSKESGGATCWKCSAIVEVPSSTDHPAGREEAVRQVFDACRLWEHRRVWDTAFQAEGSGELMQLGHERRVLDYSLTRPALGGLISPRDFVDLREWSYVRTLSVCSRAYHLFLSPKVWCWCWFPRLRMMAALIPG